MPDPFRVDAHPGAGRILFVGDVHGSHARSWMDIVAKAGLNLRGFGTVNGTIPQDMLVPTYSPLPQNPRTPLHRPLLTNHRLVNVLLRTVDDLYEQRLTRRALRRVIRDWRPDIVHTLGVFPASVFYARAMAFESPAKPLWVVQARGGPDIEVNRFLAGRHGELEQVLKSCDFFIADTDQNLDAAIELGLAPEKRSSIGRVPGTGGIDVHAIAAYSAAPPSKRERVILVPKGYEHIQSKALPILEALRLCWEQLKPCSVIMTAVNEEMLPWIKQMPQEIQAMMTVHVRLPRDRIFELMGRAKVVLAPSIMDGIPNTLLESMALGAIPIVSPLPTITPHVADPQNVIFARNLYPHEIADALVRALNAGPECDVLAKRNLALVEQLGDQARFKPHIIAFYRDAIERQRSRVGTGKGT